MTKGLIVDRKELYEVICALSEADVQKAVSYVSFLRFAELYGEKDVTDLLKTEKSAEPEGLILPRSAETARRMLKTEKSAEPEEAGIPVVRSEEDDHPVPAAAAEDATSEILEEAPEISDAENPDLKVVESQDEDFDLKVAEPKDEGFDLKVAESKERDSDFEAAEPEKPVSEAPAENFNVDDFYAPVRSPRLDMPSKQADPEPEKEKPKAADDSSWFRLWPSKETAKEPEEEVPSIFEPLEENDEPANSASTETAAASSPVKSAEDESKKAASASYQPDDFFMPVRSQRFDQLRKTSEPERTKEPERTAMPDLPEIVVKAPAPGESAFGEEPMSLFAPEETPAETPVSTPEPAPKKVSLYAERLIQLRKHLHLRWDELASLLDVPVEALYSWFGEADPTIEQGASIDYFLEVAKRVEKTGIPRFDLAVHLPLSGGDLFLDRMKKQKITGQDLKTLKAAAERADDLRRKPKGATKPYYPFQDTIDLYSTPLYGEAE